MEVLRQWAICITVSSLTGAVIYALSPKGNMQRVMKIIVCVFFLCAIVSPLINGRVLEFKLDSVDTMAVPQVQNEELNDNINTHMIDVSKEMTEEQVNSILYSHQIYNGQIYSYMDIDSNGSIFIKAMTIKLPSQDIKKKKDILDSICSQFGVESKIITIVETKDNEG